MLFIHTRLFTDEKINVVEIKVKLNTIIFDSKFNFV